MTFDRTQKPEMVRSQPGNYLSHNDALQALEDSVNKHTSHALSDADYSLTATQFGEFGFIEFTGALTAARAITIPQVGSPAADQHFRMVVHNATTGAFNLTFGYGTGATVTVAAGQQVEIQGDGTDVTRGADQNIMDLPVGTIDGASDYLAFYDTSLGILSRILGDNLPGSGGGGGGVDGTSSTILHVQDQKAEDTVPQTLTADAWNTRNVNTVLTNEITGASVATNQVTLPAGTYRVRALAGLRGADDQRHRLRVENTTDSLVVADGVGQYMGTTTHTTYAQCYGSFTISAEKVFEVQHFATDSATGGLAIGPATATTLTEEIYLDAVFEKVEVRPTVQTTDATQTTLHNEAIPADYGLTLEVTVQGREPATGALFSQTLFAVVRNEGGTGSISTVTKGTAASLGTVTGWAADLDIDTTPAPDEWRVRVTGATAMTIDWTATIKRITQTD